MNKKDDLKELFDKIDLTYSGPNMESIILRRIKRQVRFAKQKQRYLLVGRISLACFIFLSCFFQLNIHASPEIIESQSFYFLVMIPILLMFLLFIQFELLFKKA